MSPMRIPFKPINQPILANGAIMEPTVLVKWFARALWRAPARGRYANRMTDACRSGAAWAIRVRSGRKWSAGLARTGAQIVHRNKRDVAIYTYLLHMHVKMPILPTCSDVVDALCFQQFVQFCANRSRMHLGGRGTGRQPSQKPKIHFCHTFYQTFVIPISMIICCSIAIGLAVYWH